MLAHLKITLYHIYIWCGPYLSFVSTCLYLVRTIFIFSVDYIYVGNYLGLPCNKAWPINSRQFGGEAPIQNKVHIDINHFQKKKCTTIRKHSVCCSAESQREFHPECMVHSAVNSFAKHCLTAEKKQVFWFSSKYHPCIKDKTQVFRFSAMYHPSIKDSAC